MLTDRQTDIQSTLTIRRGYRSWRA